MKIKVLLTSISFLAAISVLPGQVTEGEKTLRTHSADTVMGWKNGGVIGVTAAQTSLTNWAAGGQNSVSVNGILSLFANYRSETSAWDNSLDVGYGLLKQGEEAFRKTDDKIDFLSKYGQKAFTNFYYAALVNIKTQMAPGYNYPNDSVRISNLFAPAYLLGAIGMDYKPNSYISAFIAPITTKMTFVADDFLSAAGAFGVEPGKKLKGELGGYIRLIYSRNDFENAFLRNISFTSKLDLFSNYLDNPQNIDVSWETLIVMKVNKYITVNLNTHLLYDDNVKIAVDENNDGITDRKGARVQFKEIFGVGFSYKF